MTRKKVAIVINDFLVGGAQRLILGHCKYFNQQEYDLHLVTLFEFPKRKDLYSDIPQHVTVHRIGMKTGRDILGYIRLFQVLQKVRPKVVFSHLFFSNTVTCFFKLFFSYILYTVEHNTYIHRRLVDRIIDRLLAPLAKRVIAVSNEVRDYVLWRQGLALENVVVIPNGIDLEPIKEFKEGVSKAQAREKIGVDNTRKVFLSVGRLTAQKNQLLLIESFAAFAEKNPDTILFIAGEGALYQILTARIEELMMKNRIILVGATSDIYNYYRVSDFLISTSKIEGMSMAYLEALAFGLPIIATKTGGTEMIIDSGVNGYCINSADRESVCMALEEIMRAPYEILSSAAIKKAEQFSIEKNVLTYKQLASV